MSILVAVPDSPEGHRALDAAVTEAQRRQTDLIIVNLQLNPLDLSSIPAEVSPVVVERAAGVDVADLVLRTLSEHEEVELLVIGMKRRTPVGKAVLGSLSQRLLLDAPVAVLAVKTKY